MSKKNFLILTISSLILTNIFGCMTPYVHPESEKWDQLALSKEYQEEKKLFEKRTGGIKYCGDIGVSSFLANPNLKPEKTCLYPSSALIITNRNDPYRKKNIQQPIQLLKVLQVIPAGFVVEYPRYNSSNLIFIHKTDETGIVDGSFLDEKTWLTYEYTGPFTYKTILGSKTVHSFKKLENDRFKKDKEGLKHYGALKDYLITNRLYDWLTE